MPNCKYFLVTEAERKHVRRRASLVAVAFFLPGHAKDLSAPPYNGSFQGVNRLAQFKRGNFCTCDVPRPG